MVPPNNVFPVLCPVCGRSDAGLPIIGQIRSQLQRESRLLVVQWHCTTATWHSTLLLLLLGTTALLLLGTTLLLLLLSSTHRSHLAQIHPLSHHPLLIQLALSSLASQKLIGWTQSESERESVSLSP